MVKCQHLDRGELTRPLLPALSADLLGSPESRGALSHWEKRSLLLRLRAPTCLELLTHGALSQFGFLFVWVLLHVRCNCTHLPSIVF